MSGVVADSKLGAASRTLLGVRSVLDSLKPGMTVRLTYGSPGSPGEIRTIGHLLVFVLGSPISLSMCKWNLPNMTMLPGWAYVARLDGSSIEMTVDG